jgi:hypothetical protein
MAYSEDNANCREKQLMDAVSEGPYCANPTAMANCNKENNYNIENGLSNDGDHNLILPQPNIHGGDKSNAIDGSSEPLALEKNACQAYNPLLTINDNLTPAYNSLLSPAPIIRFPPLPIVNRLPAVTKQTCKKIPEKQMGFIQKFKKHWNGDQLSYCESTKEVYKRINAVATFDAGTGGNNNCLFQSVIFDLRCENGEYKDDETINFDRPDPNFTAEIGGRRMNAMELRKAVADVAKNEVKDFRESISKTLSPPKDDLIKWKFADALSSNIYKNSSPNAMQEMVSAYVGGYAISVLTGRPFLVFGDIDFSDDSVAIIDAKGRDKFLSFRTNDAPLIFFNNTKTRIAKFNTLN